MTLTLTTKRALIPGQATGYSTGALHWDDSWSGKRLLLRCAHGNDSGNLNIQSVQWLHIWMTFQINCHREECISRRGDLFIAYLCELPC